MDQQRTIWTVIIAAVVVIMVVISAMAYQSTQSSVGSVGSTAAVDYKPYRALTFDLNVPALTGARYVLWAVDTSGQYTMLKDFLVNDSLFVTDLTGKPLSTTVSTPDYDLHQAVSFVVTVEEKEGTITTPSATVVLQTQQHSGAGYTLTFPYNVSGTGSYVLESPTNGPDTQETAGIWFTSPAALTLPVAPTGWIYAAWIHHAGTVWLPIGAFADAQAGDDLAQFSGPRSAPIAPGEDFLTNARTGDPTFPLDLTDGQSVVVITLQPADLATKDSRPVYQLPVLQAPIAPAAVTGTVYNLEATTALPNGVIRIITK